MARTHHLAARTPRDGAVTGGSVATATPGVISQAIVEDVVDPSLEEVHGEVSDLKSRMGNVELHMNTV